MHHVPKVLLYGELFPGAFRMLVSFVLLFSHVWACFCLLKFQEEATYFLLAHTVYLTMTIKILTVDHTCRFFPSCTCPCFVPHCSSLLVQLLEKLAGNETGLLQGFKLLLDLSLQLELSKAADCPLPCKRSCVLLVSTMGQSQSSWDWKSGSCWKVHMVETPVYFCKGKMVFR